MIERGGGRYQVHTVEFGQVYKWCPERVVVQCEYGERWIATPSETTCGWCGQDHAAILRKESDVEQVGDKAVHPWRYAGDREDARIPFYKSFDSGHHWRDVAGKGGYMGEAAGRTAVVYDARADEFDEPLRVFVTGYSATGLRGRWRSRGDLRYSWLEDYLVRLEGKEARREYYSRL